MSATLVAAAAAATVSVGATLSGNNFNVSQLGTGAAPGASARPQDSKGPLLAAVSWGLTAIMLVSVMLRFYSRGVILRIIGYEDWAIIPAAVSLARP